MSRARSIAGAAAVLRLVPLSLELAGRRRRFRRALDAVEREWRAAAAGGRFGDSRAREDDLFFDVLAPCGAGSYCKLIGRPFTGEACRVVALACAFVFPYDDLIDEQGISREHLDRVLHDPSCVPRSAEEHRAGYFYRRLVALPAVRDNALFHAAVARQNEAHLVGIDQQRDPSASLAAVQAATHAKASSTLLLGLSLLNPAMSPREQDAAAELAMWVQLVDDAMDRRRDRAAGVRTLMTDCADFSAVFELLEGCRIRTFEKYRSLAEYDERRMDAYLFELYAAGVLVTVRLYLEERAGRSSAVRDAARLAYRLLARYSRDASMRPVVLP
ncbi:hypothetical protein [Nannocystis punicea]|uniref:Uncharacterized protein n=1 Tax=Nannocystis punicea TaxID=2995304 RepID=A0ABY7GX95_9BACT|nr:hypothetical protein [Nannocystis poenicansa]WAS91604.1 hypothetical protein O0S08_35940 [Nannocystis poenicansa]